MTQHNAFKPCHTICLVPCIATQENSWESFDNLSRLRRLLAAHRQSSMYY